MESNIPALVMGFREGLEAFLIVGVMLRMLSEGSLQSLKRHVWSGVWVSHPSFLDGAYMLWGAFSVKLKG
jgi:high-affinity Fe2+/Pb2+ permease